MKKCRSLNASLGTRATASRGRNYGQKKNKYDKDNIISLNCLKIYGIINIQKIIKIARKKANKKTRDTPKYSGLFYFLESSISSFYK